MLFYKNNDPGLFSTNVTNQIFKKNLTIIIINNTNKQIKKMIIKKQIKKDNNKYNKYNSEAVVAYKIIDNGGASAEMK